MNRLLKAGIAALLAITLAVPAVAIAKMAINMDPAEQPVEFSHARHANVACVTCHSATASPTAPDYTMQLTAVPLSCQACHTPNDGGGQTAACIDCHNSVAP